MFQRKDGTGAHDQFLVPSELLQHMHNNVLSGHLGGKNIQTNVYVSISFASVKAYKLDHSV